MKFGTGVRQGYWLSPILFKLQGERVPYKSWSWDLGAFIGGGHVISTM